MRERIINFSRPDVGWYEMHRVKKTMKTGWLTTGPRVKEFQDRIAMMSGCEYAVAFDSCTTALEFALMIYGVGPGDEVITTPLTYTATADVIGRVGAKIVFVDTDGESFEMDYDKVEDAITSKTKAIIAVDYGGKICNYERIYQAVENKKDLFEPYSVLQKKLGRVAVIADAAHSFRAFKKNEDDVFEPSGMFADITCFSFHVLKGITTGGEGGAIVFRLPDKDLDWATNEVLIGLRHHFQTGKDIVNGWEYDIEGIGCNRPMTDINASIGLAQLDRYDEIFAKRVDLTLRYDEGFAKIDGIRPMLEHFGDDHISACHLYPVAVYPKETKGTPTEFEEFRNKIILKMKEMGVQCNVHYKPLPMMTAYKRLGFDIKDFPNAYKQYASLVTIPYHALLSKKDADRVVSCLGKAVENG